MLANAASSSLSLLALRTTICLPRAVAAVCAADNSILPLGLFGFMRKAMTVACGTSSYNSCNRLVIAAGPNMVTPVALPPGRLRLSTKPSLTRSPNMPNTIGCLSSCLGDLRRRIAPTCDYYGDLSAYQIGCKLRQSIIVTLSPTILNGDILP